MTSVRSYLILTAIAFFSGLTFSHYINVFFSADDFYNMYLVFHSSWVDVVKAFLFNRRPDYLFYRPLSTQLYFFLVKRFFDLNPFGYHLLSGVIFSAIVFFVYKLIFVMTRDSRISLYSSFFYAFSASNFNRLAWVSQMQELIFTFLSLLTIFFWLLYCNFKKTFHLICSGFFFILALASKESAVILPILLVVSYLFRIKSKSYISLFKLILPFLIVSAVYVYLRFFVMGISLGSNYFTSYQPNKIINTLVWYGLWSLGLPELLVNFKYFSEGPYFLNPKIVNYLLTDMSDILINFGVLLFLIAIATLVTVRSILQNYRLHRAVAGLVFFGLVWFIVALLPHIFSPFHKFPYELTLSLVGSCLAISVIVLRAADIIASYKSYLGIFFPCLVAAVYISATFSAVKVELWNSWVVQRGDIARKVITYFKTTFPDFPKDKKVIFFNDIPVVNNIIGVSRQIELAISESKALKLVYDDPTIMVIFEDDEIIKNQCSSKTLMVRSSKFFSF